MDNIRGITAGDWWRLLKDNNFSIGSSYRRRAAMISWISLWNSRNRRIEEHEFGDVIRKVDVNAPIFILGHWRSGTTLIHNLLTHGSQFAYPNLFQVSNPQGMLSREKVALKRHEKPVPVKRAMDNVKVTIFSPGEDEFALSSMTQLSPLISWSFPKRASYYDRYLTFCSVPEDIVDKWKSAVMFYYQKLTYRYDRTLIFKSPAHTGRIRLLLDLFPDAQFIHISRNPYTVFQSTRKLYKTAVANSRLQDQDETHEINCILYRYVLMYDAYFDKRKLIPEGNLIEIKYEDLEKDKNGQIAKIYEVFNLPGFADIEQGIKQYTDSLQGYKKNYYKPMSEDLKLRVADVWARNFELWNYPL